MDILVCASTIHYFCSEQFRGAQHFMNKEKKKGAAAAIMALTGNGRKMENSAFCQAGEWAEHQLAQSSPGRGAAQGVNGTIFHFLGKETQTGYWSRCFYGN